MESTESIIPFDISRVKKEPLEIWYESDAVMETSHDLGQENQLRRGVQGSELSAQMKVEPSLYYNSTYHPISLTMSSISLAENRPGKLTGNVESANLTESTTTPQPVPVALFDEQGFIGTYSNRMVLPPEKVVESPSSVWQEHTVAGDTTAPPLVYFDNALDGSMKEDCETSQSNTTQTRVNESSSDHASDHDTVDRFSPPSPEWDEKESSEQFSPTEGSRRGRQRRRQKPAIKTQTSKEYVCYCGQTFTYPSRLKSHMFKVHGQGSHADVRVDDKRHGCTQCGEMFRVPSRLEYHMFKVHGVGDPEKFNISRKPHTCSCGQSFSCPSRLKSHMYKTHGEGSPLDVKVDHKKHMCKECGEMFRVPSRLRYHMFKVHGEGNPQEFCIRAKPHFCTECEKSFHSRARLLHHLFRAHQIGDESNVYHRQKKHVCDQCSRLFLSPSRLKFHLFKVHGMADPVDLPHFPKRYICMTCGKTFSSKQRHRHHLFKEHGKVMLPTYSSKPRTMCVTRVEILFIILLDFDSISTRHME
ncbi:zinc finger protein 567-like [Liolophura sinensis]|uniref:zinc finger protein 567-like n=1 Tax=Liolophura sinensis TaxID=3198878 RepID=UPI003158A219